MVHEKQLMCIYRNDQIGLQRLYLHPHLVYRDEGSLHQEFMSHFGSFDYIYSTGLQLAKKATFSDLYSTLNWYTVLQLTCEVENIYNVNRKRNLHLLA